VSLPSDYAFQASDNGSHTFVGEVTLVTPGSQEVRVDDTVDNSLWDRETWIVTAETTWSISAGAGK